MLPYGIISSIIIYLCDNCINYFSLSVNFAIFINIFCNTKIMNWLFCVFFSKCHIQMTEIINFHPKQSRKLVFFSPSGEENSLGWTMEQKYERKYFIQNSFKFIQRRRRSEYLIDSVFLKKIIFSSSRIFIFKIFWKL